MMTVTAFAGGRKPRNDHIGLELPDHPNHIAQDLFLVPFCECLLRALRVTEVERTSEELLSSIHPSRGQELLRPDQSQFNSLFVPYQVLSSVAPRHRQVTGADHAVLGKVGDQPGILIIRMCSYVQYGAEYIQLSDRQVHVGGCPCLGWLRKRVSHNEQGAYSQQ